MCDAAVCGKLRAVGADWLQLRRDGVANLDVRAMAETNDGALLYITYDGTIDLGENGYEDLLKGVMPPDPDRDARRHDRRTSAHRRGAAAGA